MPDTPDFGPSYEVVEVKTWRVRCRHCHVTRWDYVPQTEKAVAATKAGLAGAAAIGGNACRNPRCVTNGGTEGTP